MEIIILKTFLTEIKKYENLYSNNVSKQVFIAYFKDFYQVIFILYRPWTYMIKK